MSVFARNLLSYPRTALAITEAALAFGGSVALAPNADATPVGGSQSAHIEPHCLPELSYVGVKPDGNLQYGNPQPTGYVEEFRLADGVTVHGVCLKSSDIVTVEQTPGSLQPAECYTHRTVEELRQEHITRHIIQRHKRRQQHHGRKHHPKSKPEVKFYGTQNGHRISYDKKTNYPLVDGLVYVEACDVHQVETQEE